MTACATPITAGREIYGAVGVSGAPRGESDEACAAPGIETIREELELSQ